MDEEREDGDQSRVFWIGWKKVGGVGEGWLTGILSSLPIAFGAILAWLSPGSLAGECNVVVSSDVNTYE